MLLSLFVLLTPALARVTSNLHLQRPLTGKDTCWTYTGIAGPLGWHRNPECPAPLCSTGTHQSPIDVNRKVSLSEDMVMDTQEEVIPAVVENTGRGIVVRPGGHWGFFSGTELRLHEGEAEEGFWLRQMVLRTPGEHFIDGEWFPVEVQGLWRSWRERMVMTSLLFQISTEGSHPFFTDIRTTLPKLAKEHSRVPFPTESLGTLIEDFYAAQRNASVRTYKGSLTVPPCAEGVTWLVSTEPGRIDVEIYNLLKKVVKFNARINMGVPGGKNLLEIACEADACEV